MKLNQKYKSMTVIYLNITNLYFYITSQFFIGHFAAMTTLRVIGEGLKNSSNLHNLERSMPNKLQVYGCYYGFQHKHHN
jgi:hypothetical protein